MFNTLIVGPLYNLMIFIMQIFPGNYLFISVVVLTLLVKIILIPLYKKQMRSQVVMQFLAPKLKELQEKYKDKKEKLGPEMLSLYSKYKVNPFSSILILLIQFPILIALYFIFFSDIKYYSNLLYSFVSLPEHINTAFFGMDLLQKSIWLGVVAGISQYFLSQQMFIKHKDIKKMQEDSMKASGNNMFGEEFQKAMEMQVKYFIPVLIFAASFVLPAVISLYIIVGNVFGVWQEVYIRRPLEENVLKELK